MNRRFIDTKPMQQELLKQLEEKFLSTDHFNTDNINVTLSLKDSVDKIVTSKQIKEPQIYILDNAWIKIQTLVQENNSEVAWHCLVEQYPDNKFVIYDVLVFPQEVTGATANGIDGEYETWLATLPDEQFDFLKCHMHSHVNMAVTPSGTDENYYNSLMTQVKDYYITMIINKSNQYHLRFYDKINNLMWYDLTFKLCDSKGNLYDDWYESIKDNIKTKTYTTPYPNLYQNNLFDSKKKETCKTKQTMTTTGITKNTTSQKEFIISSPTNECLVFKDCNEATEYIYKLYEPTIRAAKAYTYFTRNELRKRLAKQEQVCIDFNTLEFVDEIDTNVNSLQYALEHCDIWEVG